MCIKRTRIIKLSKKKLKSLKKKIGSHPQILGIVFLFLGVLILSFPSLYSSLYKEPHPKKNSQNPIKIDPSLLSFKEPSQPPVRVIIPNLKISLPIVEAKVVGGFWQVSEDSASHGIGSANPGEKGNMVIFAHARKGFFLPLKDIKEKDIIYVFTKDHWYQYQVFQIKTVFPNEIEVIKPTEDEVLTLFTCTGFADTKRLVVTAKRVP